MTKTHRLSSFFFTSRLQGFRVPNPAVAVLMELMTTQALTPGASFTGHACGAIAGLFYVLFHDVYVYQGIGLRFRRQLARFTGPVHHTTFFGSGTSGHAHEE